MPKPSNHPQLTRTLDAIRRIIQVLRRSTGQSERDVGIGAAQLFVLQQLSNSPAGSVNELAERTYTHQSSVSVVVERLVEQGLVVRRPGADDRRRRELRLTPAGKRLVARAPVPGQVRLIDGLLALPATQLRTLERLLGRVVREMGAELERPEMLFVEEVRGRRHSRDRSSGRRQLLQKTSRGRRKTRPARPRR